MGVGYCTVIGCWDVKVGTQEGEVRPVWCELTYRQVLLLCSMDLLWPAD